MYVHVCSAIELIISRVYHSCGQEEPLRVKAMALETLNSQELQTTAKCILILC